MKSKMNVIVTGGTSFIGLEVISRLIKLDCRIWAIVRPESANRSKLPDHKNLNIIEKSLDELDTLTDVDKLKTPEKKVFLHMAWDGVGSAGRSDEGIQAENVKNSMKALKAAADLGCERFVFSGSQSEYGICSDVMREDGKCSPVSEYGKAKLKFGRQAEEFCKGNMEYVHCRIFSVYGPGDHPWSLVNTCLKTFSQGKHMELGECTQKWNFLYIKDMAEAIVSLLLCGKKGIDGIYNIAGNDTRVLREFVEEMYECCLRTGSFTYGKRPPNAEGPASLIPSIEKITAVTGWTPSTPFKEGIEETRRCLI